ncbi:ORF35 [Plodia interpunctella granulovirus]|uniref:ORF35 n=1 Tax=Plodia interpunctella granulovirus TaxID=262175 RepID=A0A1L5JH03_9BBAC|nr:ORF35 [Plodia interpunctella granulovirus]APO13919.1 ORF35 [Plodia interpunctella granulovirus]
MDMVMEKKRIFMKLAHQLNPKSINKLKPHVHKLYSFINVYCITQEESQLRLMYSTLCECISLMTRELVKDRKYDILETIKE